MRCKVDAVSTKLGLVLFARKFSFDKMCSTPDRPGRYGAIIFLLVKQLNRLRFASRWEKLALISLMLQLDYCCDYR